MQNSEYFELRELCRARNYIVDMGGDLKKKVISLLDQVFPEYETLFSDIFGITSMELLINCPTPETLVDMISKTSRNRFKITKALEIKKLATQSFGIILGTETMKLLIKHHVEHFEFM